MLQRSFRDKTVRSERTKLRENVGINWTILSSVARIAIPGGVVFLVCMFDLRSALETNEEDRKTRKIASWTESRCTT